MDDSHYTKVYLGKVPGKVGPMPCLECTLLWALHIGLEYDRTVLLSEHSGASVGPGCGRARAGQKVWRCGRRRCAATLEVGVGEYRFVRRYLEQPATAVEPAAGRSSQMQWMEVR